MSFQRRVSYSVAALAASVACVAGMSNAAVANDFMAEDENGKAQLGEIQVKVENDEGELEDLACVAGCIDVGSMIESIVSLNDSTSGTYSRLFVDYFGNGDTKQVYENDSEKIVFKTRDKGTNSEGYWFRPSEGNGEEKGQLEVGTFMLNFAQTMSELTIDFFDTESRNSTGVLAINGVTLENPDYVAKGSDGNIVSQTFYNVESLTLKLGEDYERGTGDGVNFKMSGTPASVPEPASVLGLMAIAGIGFGLKKKASPNAA